MKDFIGSHRLSEKTKGVLANRLFADQRLLELQNLLQEEAQSLSSALRQVQARLLMHQGNVAQAISTLEYSSPSMEESPEYYALLASFYQRSGQSEKAFDQYSQLIQSNETIADWWAGLGVSADQLKQSRQAKFAYQQALELPGLNMALDSYIRQRLSALSSVR